MINRRNLLLGGVAAGILAACTRTRGETSGFVSPDGPEVQAAEAARGSGPVKQIRLEAAVSQHDLGGRVVSTWSYNGGVPGPAIRVNAGETIKATLVNRLPEETSIHWHGLALRNDADGVPHLTQQPAKAGAEFVYQFTAPDPGTYWFHPHTGTQLDRGLYAPLIVEDPREPLSYDDEWVVVLDDWLDRSPDDVLAELRKGMAHGGGHEMARSILLGGDAGDVRYPAYVLNGRVPADPQVYQGKPGQRLRIRLINAAGDTAFRVAIGGHRMTVTHTDGFPIQPVDADALLIGMGERYDVLVTLADGIFPLVAVAEGKDDAAFALIRTGAGEPPPASARPAELERRIASYRMMKATDQVALPAKEPNRTIRLELTGGMERYDWGFNGKPFDHTKPLAHAYEVAAGERVRIEYVNTTTMFHPVHLHGHTFAIDDAGGARKDTAIVLPGQTLTTLFDANNPGLWMIHCHNVYHAEAGMMTVLGYRRREG